MANGRDAQWGRPALRPHGADRGARPGRSGCTRRALGVSEAPGPPVTLPTARSISGVRRLACGARQGRTVRALSKPLSTRGPLAVRPTVRQGALVAPKPFAKALSTRGALGERTASRPRVLTPLLCALGVRGVTRPTRIRSPAPRGAEAPRRDRCHFCGGSFAVTLVERLECPPPGGWSGRTVPEVPLAGASVPRDARSPCQTPLPARVPRLESARTRARTISVRPGCTISVRPNSINWETGEVTDGPGAPVTRTPGRGWSGRPPSEAFAGGKAPTERFCGWWGGLDCTRRSFHGWKTARRTFCGCQRGPIGTRRSLCGWKSTHRTFRGWRCGPICTRRGFHGWRCGLLGARKNAPRVPPAV